MGDIMKKMNAKAKQKMLAGVALVVVVILVLSGIYVYDKYYKEEEEDVEEDEVRVIDDRISPLNENQGVVIEVLRIRHRGLREKFEDLGNSWKNRPTFFFKTNIDDQEFAANKVGQHGTSVEINFANMWDSMFMERKIVRDAEEEQETSTLTLTIFEKITTRKLLKKTTTDVERDSITIEYDYRTGRWSGDDNFDDEDGYGHHLGETFEVWFNVYQMDNDNDFIPYWTEVNVLGTDPRRDDSNKDPDGDGCPTAWEWKWGYDPFTWDDHEKLDPDLDGLENIEEYQMARWHANPFYQEIYVEVDSVEAGGRFNPAIKLYTESEQIMIENFAKHHISIYFDDGWPNGPIGGGGEHLPYWEKLSQDSGMILEYYNNYFPQERRGVFRYLVLGHSGGYNHPAKNNVYDCTYIVHVPLLPYKPWKKVKVFFRYGTVGTKRGIRIQLAGIIMHELGHSIGLGGGQFEGVDNTSAGWPRFPNKNYPWVAYRSVMNYQCIYDRHVLDYSDGSNGPPYDQNDWEKIFVSAFQYNDALIEDPGIEGHGTFIFGEEDHTVTGYVYDENLTQDFIEMIGDWSPVDPIGANWSVYKLVNKEDNPNCKDVKILAQSKDVPYAEWCEYAEGMFDSEGKITFYSQEDIIAEIMELI